MSSDMAWDVDGEDIGVELVGEEESSNGGNRLVMGYRDFKNY